MKYAWIHEHRAVFRINAMCRCLGATRPGYYPWLREGTDDESDRALIAESLDIMEASLYTYGIKRVTKALQDRGFHVNHKRVERLMKENNIRCKKARKFKKTTNSDHKFPASVVCAALMSALSRRPGARQLIQSDRGIQYASAEFRRLLWRNKLRQSMSRKGDCFDNAVAESFFGILKTELELRPFMPTGVVRQAVFEYIEAFYNRKRYHSHLGCKTPEEVEQVYWSPVRHRRNQLVYERGDGPHIRVLVVGNAKDVIPNADKIPARGRNATGGETMAQQPMFYHEDGPPPHVRRFLRLAEHPRQKFEPSLYGRPQRPDLWLRL